MKHAIIVASFVISSAALQIADHGEAAVMFFIIAVFGWFIMAASS